MTSLQRVGQQPAPWADHLSQALLSSLKEHIVVLDPDGVIVTCNDSWRHLVEGSADELVPGANLLESYRTSGSAETSELVPGLESVLSGSRNEFTLEFLCPVLKTRWFLVTAIPLKDPGNGVVVSYTDITQRKRAEEETRRTRDELAHAVRVSMMGELMASLAHELNQPLAAIRSNAQAALRFLGSPVPNFEEVRSALAEIVEDDRWASEVIRRLRMLARRGDVERVLIDLNDIFRETLQLVRTEAIERGVSVELDLASGLPSVLGDRVQLQQVALNLLLNAIEAMTEAEGRRILTVRSASGGGSLTVSVQDTGRGLGAAEMDRIFDAFYTTKSEGMGMGLSISLSIIEAHGGRLWGEHNEERGMTFHFSLPVATV